jgi:2-polyprenyl-3-methyl-5-hydroxy-6-metoxy-1,4-benzoquinol methylase
MKTYNFRKCFGSKFLKEKLKLLLDNNDAYKLAEENKDKDDDDIFAMLTKVYKKIDNEYFNVHKIKYLSNIEIKSNMRILDFGGANGKIADAIGQEYKMTVDICDVHRADYAIKSDRIKYEQVLNNKLPYAENQFDVITCFMVLHHISPNDIQKIVSELYRCCKRYILIQEHNCDNDMQYILNILHGLYIFVYKDEDYDELKSMGEYQAWYKSAGQFDALFHGKFKLVKRFYTNKVQENFVAIYEKI